MGEYINGSAYLYMFEVTEAGPEVPKGLMKYQEFPLDRKLVSELVRSL